MRIKFIIPFPFDDEGIANRAAQIPREILGPDTEVECVPVRNSATLIDCYYEDARLRHVHRRGRPPRRGGGL